MGRAEKERVLDPAGNRSGERFLMIRQLCDRPATEIVVVENWFEDPGQILRYLFSHI